MIDKELFRKTEGRLYRHYKQLKQIEKLKSKVVLLWKQKEAIERDIKETNIIIEPESKSIDYSKDKIASSSDGASYAEKEMIRAIENLERELLYKKKKILKLHTRIRELEEQNADMTYNISLLSEENKRFLEAKYSAKMSIEETGEILHMVRATAYRKREELVENIAQWCNIL